MSAIWLKRSKFVDCNQEFLTIEIFRIINKNSQNQMKKCDTSFLFLITYHTDPKIQQKHLFMKNVAFRALIHLQIDF